MRRNSCTPGETKAPVLQRLRITGYSDVESNPEDCSQEVFSE